jgi:hypothetical protein
VEGYKRKKRLTGGALWFAAVLYGQVSGRRLKHLGIERRKGRSGVVAGGGALGVYRRRVNGR